MVVRTKFMEMQARWLISSETGSPQGNWKVANKIRENHVRHDMNEGALIQGGYKHHKL